MSQQAEARRFLNYCWGTLSSPAKTFTNLLDDPHKLKLGFIVCLTLGILYSILVLVAYLNGIPPVVKPILPIPLESYYLWQAYFTIPVSLITFIVFAALAQLIARPFKGVGSFSGNFAVLSFGYTVPSLVLFWLPEMVMVSMGTNLSDASTLVVALNNARMIIAFTWAGILCVWGMKLSQRLSSRKAILVTIAALIPSLGIFMTFIR